MDPYEMTTSDYRDLDNRVIGMEAIEAQMVETLKKAEGHPDLTTDDKRYFVGYLQDGLSDLRFRLNELRELMADYEAVVSYGSVRDRETGQ